ncbi:hypothetical protein VT03_23630 [Planctomyces sp. SH-PL14]|nr:hypothetical protein VT03_23630 [Planctomyces sp. SH-PL14]
MNTRTLTNGQTDQPVCLTDTALRTATVPWGRWPACRQAFIADR